VRKRSVLVVAVMVGGVLLLGSTACFQGAATETTLAVGGLTTTSVPADPVATPRWTDLQPAGAAPAPRFGHSLAYDPAGGKVILFGGRDAEDYVDTWAFDPGTDTWTLLNPGGRRPWARHGHAMVYDPSRGRIILFGGTSMAGLLIGLNDLWIYDPAANTWTMLTPSGDVPPGRSGHAMAYDPVTRKVILFGGSAQSQYLGDTWTYDPASNSWTQINPLGDRPSARYAASLVFDPGLNKLLLFGGRDANDLNDIWAFDPATKTWTRLNPVGDVPPPRYHNGMVYDTQAGRTILFGGNAQDVGYLNDTWTYDSAANSWTKLETEGEPPAARFACGLVFVPEAGRTILFGGADKSKTFADTWGYSGRP
jgi:N-acetylneuraminic acid mutarotase